MYIFIYVYYIRHFLALSARKFVALSVDTPLCPYGIAYRRAYGLFAYGLFQNMALKCAVWRDAVRNGRMRNLLDSGSVYLV